MTPHKHAKLMNLYYQDALETNTPWERWQFKLDNADWRDCESHSPPIWSEHVEYRRKTPVVRYVFEFPEPMRKYPKDGDYYFVADALACDYYQLCVWNGKEPDHGWFNRGLCYENKEDAITAGRARCIQWMK